MSIYCDYLFGWSQKRNYIGNILNFNNITTLQAQRIFDATASSGKNPTGVPIIYTGLSTGISVNGISFGTGRITSFNNPVSIDISEDGRHLWKQIITVDVYESGDLSNISGYSDITGLLLAYNQYLTSLDENFSFSTEQNGDYTYSHTASIKCIDDITGQTSGYIFAQNIASGLLSSSPPFGYVDAVNSGLYLTSGKRLYNESIDIFNGAVSFEEKFIIQSRDIIKHSIIFSDGYFNITESATIRHSGISKSEDIFNNNPNNIITRFNSCFNNSYSRCNTLYNNYYNLFNSDTYSATLSIYPSQITKGFDERSQDFTYSVTYTNSPYLINGYSIEREQSISIANNNIIEASEQGNLIFYQNKQGSHGAKSNLINGINAEIAGSFNRITGFYSGISTFKEKNESKTFSPAGKKASYSITYTNDPSFYNDGTFLTKVFSIQNNNAILITNPYLVLGKQYPLLHSPGLSTLGSISCNVKSNLFRPTGYYPENPVRPDSALNLLITNCINYALNNLTSLNPNDIFLSKLSYEYNSNYESNVNIELQYTYTQTQSY